MFEKIKSSKNKITEFTNKNQINLLALEVGFLGYNVILFIFLNIEYIFRANIIALTYFIIFFIIINFTKFLYKKIFKKGKLYNGYGNFTKILVDMLISFYKSGIVAFIILLGGALWVNNNYYFELQKHIITNGERTIVFQEMAHIGTRDFYIKIKNDIDKYMKDGYKIYGEGVLSDGTDEEKKTTETNFNKMIGFKIDGETYGSISKLFGLENQDLGFLYQNVSTGSFVRADTTMANLVNIYEEKYGTGYVNNKVIEGDKLEAIFNLSDFKYLNPVGKLVFSEISKSTLNIIQRNDNLNSGIIKVSENLRASNSMKNIKEVILNHRNSILVNDFIYKEGNQDDKIYINYGMLHFSGVLKLLKEKDDRWYEISSEKYKVF